MEHVRGALEQEVVVERAVTGERLAADAGGTELDVGVALSVCDPEARCTESVQVPFEATVAVPTTVEPS